MASDNASSQQPSLDAETVEQTKQQIRGLVTEIAQLSKSDLAPQEYYAAFLQRIVSALAAVGGAVWVLGEERRLELVYQIKLSETLLDPESQDAVRHLRLLDYIVHQRQSQLAPPLSGSSEEGGGGNPTRFLLVLCPLQTGEEVEGVIEIFQRPDSQPATQRGYLRFLQRMCEVAGEWLKTRKLKQFTDRHSLWGQADHFARLVHESLDVRETAYTAANEGRRLIGCDRVSLAIMKGRRCKVEAVSGQDTLENRSNIVAGLGRLATRVVAAGEPLWYEGATEDLPPQIEKALEAYVDESHTRWLAVLPLRKPGPPAGGEPQTATGDPVGEENVEREVIGALIVEQIESRLPREILAPRIDLVYEHTARAVANAVDHSSLFLMPLWRTIGKAKWLVRARTLPKTLAVTAVVVAAIVALVALPADLKLQANGTLQPVLKRDVFAGVEGVVENVPFAHDEWVEQGQVVASLHNPDLLVQWEDVLGQRSSTIERLLSVQRELLLPNLTDLQKSQLSGERAQLQQQLKSLDEQVKLLERKRDELQVKSPISGRVITWDVKKLLTHRFVTPGQVLMTVADTNDEWELELYMPERRMGHVNQARRRFGEDLPVTYILFTDPGVHHQGVVEDVDPSTSMHEDEGASVRIRVRLDAQETQSLLDPRPGANVKGELLCGRRAIGYVWFHEAMEWVQMHILFRFF